MFGICDVAVVGCSAFMLDLVRVRSTVRNGSVSGNVLYGVI